MPRLTNAFFNCLFVKSVLPYKRGIAASRSHLPQCAGTRGSHASRTHRWVQAPAPGADAGIPVAWENRRCTPGRRLWKQADKISNVARPYSQFAPEVPLVKRSNGAARGGRWAALVCHTAAEVNLWHCRTCVMQILLVPSGCELPEGPVIHR